jgi:hypothetical protein
MQNTTIINDFRKWFHFQKSKDLTGPTGHKYLVNKGTFSSLYFLQSYEFGLLAESTLRLMEQYDLFH